MMGYHRGDSNDSAGAGRHGVVDGSSSSSVRKYWGHSARERNRRYARSQIRQRILRHDQPRDVAATTATATAEDDSNDASDHDSNDNDAINGKRDNRRCHLHNAIESNDHERSQPQPQPQRRRQQGEQPTSSAPLNQTASRGRIPRNNDAVHGVMNDDEQEVRNDDDDDTATRMIRDVYMHVIKNWRSYFSLITLQRYRAIFERPYPIRTLYASTSQELPNNEDYGNDNNKNHDHDHHDGRHPPPQKTKDSSSNNNNNSKLLVLVGQEQLVSYEKIHWYGTNEKVTDFLRDFVGCCRPSRRTDNNHPVIDDDVEEQGVGNNEAPGRAPLSSTPGFLQVLREVVAVEEEEEEQPHDRAGGHNNNGMTLYEFAVWMRRYSIVSSLILGGINPCIRDVILLVDHTEQQVDKEQQQQQAKSSLEQQGMQQYENRLRTFGLHVLKRFLEGKVPLPLSAYVVARIVRLRQRERRRRRLQRTTSRRREGERITPGTGAADAAADVNACSCCMVCHERSDCLLIRWPHEAGIEDRWEGPTNDEPAKDGGAARVPKTQHHHHLHHSVCELCVWKCALDRIEEQTHGSHYRDVVVCPVCYTEPAKRGDPRSTEEEDANARLTDTPASYVAPAIEASVPNRPHPIRTKRCEDSKAKYYSLPCDVKDLFQLQRRQEHERKAAAASDGENNKNKKKTKNKSNNKKGEIELCQTWSEAVASKVGLCQTIRQEKFFTHVEEGNYHYVYGCIEHGIDVNGARNEYGQTGFFVACWRGYAPIARLFLDHGCDATIASNGGTTAVDAARANDRDPIVEMIRQYSAASDEISVLKRDSADPIKEIGKIDDSNNINWRIPFLDLKEKKAVNIPPISCDVGSSVEDTRPRTQTLIPESSDHPGAGSYLIDNAVSDGIADALVRLWESVPVATEVKQKTGPCSVRSYFCDAEALVTNLLEESICNSNVGSRVHDKCACTQSRRCCTVLSQMRFLHYHEPGLVLAPHTDLCRVDVASGETSTHTFILYLSDCVSGGATVLLNELPNSASERPSAMARVLPRRRRLLLFPHLCPHEGEEVIEVPKLLLRGEVILR